MKILKRLLVVVIGFILITPLARADMLDNVDKIYVVDFTGDIPKKWGPTLAAMVSARLLDALQSRHIEVFTWLNLKQQLNVEQKKEVLQCSEDQGCIETIISGFGIATKLFGHITRLSKGKYSISLTLMRHAKPLNKLAPVVNTTQDGLLSVVPGLALELVGMGRSRGPVSISGGVVDETGTAVPSGPAPPPLPVMVKFRSVPSGAVVLVDGKIVCQGTPCSQNVYTGTHRIEFQKVRYVPGKKTVDIRSDTTVSLKLMPDFGFLNITSTPSGLPVTVNGSPKGSAPLDLELTAGQAFRINHSSECFYPQAKRVVLTRGQHLEVDLSPKPKQGWVQVLASDKKGNALKGRVFIDGKDVGTTPGNFHVSVCAKELKVKTKKGEYKTDLKVDVSQVLRVEAVIFLSSPGFVRIPSGCFAMGSPKGENGRDNDEGPVHRVCISRSFMMSKTEVTQGQWKALMGNNPSYFDSCGDNCPVEQVSWWDAIAYANALSQKEGLERCYSLRGCRGTPGEKGYKCGKVRFKGLDCKGYRLPTEAEWEYAARAGTKTALYTGGLTIKSKNNGPELDPIAWYGGNSGVGYSGGYDCSGWDDKQYSSERCGPHPVGKKRPNSWGLYDMLGNVWEWVWDWYKGGYYNGSPSRDPLGPGAGSYRVYRGGSWRNIARYCRSANRDFNSPGFRYNFLGFRLCRSL